MDAQPNLNPSRGEAEPAYPGKAGALRAARGRPRPEPKMITSYWLLSLILGLIALILLKLR